MLVARGLFHEGAWGLGSWLTVGVLAALPAGVIRALWLVILAEPLADAGTAAVSANVAGIVTWLGVMAAFRRFFRRKRVVGRHGERREPRSG